MSTATPISDIRGSMPMAARPAALILATWVTIALIFLMIFMGAQQSHQVEKIYLIGLVGAWRYSWQLVHFVRSKLYLRVIWPSIRKQMDQHPEPMPKRLYFLIPSYNEKPATTEMMLRSILAETLPLADKVQVTLVINLASDHERSFVHDLISQYPGAHTRLNVILMHQEDGKRLAIGYGLRAISRTFNDPAQWHADTENDLVILMDGDSILEEGFLKKALPIFKVKPDITAVTTHNETRSPDPSSLMHQWYNLKFSQRHFLFCSHSLSERVLTLTGRLSIYRAANILNEEFIQSVESDFVDHWIFGRYPFLMGDDKSTWYTLLKQGKKMLYIPDAKIYCQEDRIHHFFKSTASLFSRWYGNMLNNNGRAMAIGPRKLGFFIWWCLVDQRLSCWTPLIGPVSSMILCATVSPAYLAYYAAWVILTRSLYLFLVTGYGLKLNLVHLPLLVYNQWYGALIKLVTLSRRDLQSWRAKDENQAKKTNTVSIKASLSFPTFRKIARYAQLVTSFSILFGVSYLLIFGLQVPESMVSSAQFRNSLKTLPSAYKSLETGVSAWHFAGNSNFRNNPNVPKPRY